MWLIGWFYIILYIKTDGVMKKYLCITAAKNLVSCNELNESVLLFIYHRLSKQKNIAIFPQETVCLY